MTRGKWCYQDAIEEPPRSNIFLTGDHDLAELGRVLSQHSKVMGYGSPTSGVTALVVAGHTIRPVSEWGVTTEEEHRKVRQCLGPMWSGGPASTAAAVFKSLCSDALCLPDRYREPARVAIYGGPALCVDSRPVQNAHMVDRVAAYLDALRYPVPIARRFSNTSNQRVMEHIVMRAIEGSTRIDGVVDMSVTVPRDLPYGPLPERWNGRVRYPTGEVRGLWPISMVAETLRRWMPLGVRLGKAYSMQVSDTDYSLLPVFEYLSDIRASMPHVSKRIYTRLYGIMCDSERYRASFRPTCVSWHCLNRRARNRQPTCRPDIAATVAGRNHAATMVESSRDPDRVLMMHVDAVMYRGPNQGRAMEGPVGSWTLRGEGEACAIAPGMYRLDGDYRVAGVERGKARKAFEVLAGRSSSGVLALRTDGRSIRNGREVAPTGKGVSPGVSMGGTWTLGGWHPKKTP